MSFALPIAIALAGLALPIIGFYILKVRLRRIPVSTNLFWKQIFDEKPPRSLWQNFRHLLSLLFQLFMLLLLVFSISDPYFPWQILQARRIVIVVDNSASMRSTDVSPTRFVAARNAARELVAGLRFRDEVAIVLAGKHPDVILGMTNHVPTLRRAIDSLAVSDTPTELGGAIELGKQLIGDHPHGQVIVFTDGCTDPKSLPKKIDTNETRELAEIGKVGASGDIEVVYRIFGTDAPNVGIIQFQVRRSLIDPIGYEALAAVKNASNSPVKCRLELVLEDVPIDVLPLELKPGETWSRSIEKTSLSGGQLVASLTQIRSGNAEPNDPASSSTASNKKGVGASLNYLTTDDSAWAILPQRRIQKVLIVSSGNLFLRKVFEANPLVKIELLNEIPATWPTDTIVVLHGMVPSTLPNGNVMVIDPTGACEHWDLGAVLENPIITEQDKNSPLMTHIRLDNVMMPEAKQIQFKVAPHILAATVDRDPVYAEVKRAEGKCLVLSVNLERSDLAFRTAFPIMATNALGWFAGQNGELRESLATGSLSSVAFDLKPNTELEQLVLQSPSKLQFPFRYVKANADARGISSTSAEGKVGPLNEAGIWQIVTRPDDKRLDDKKLDSERSKLAKVEQAEERSLFEIAANLANARETDLYPSKDLIDSTKNQSNFTGWLGRPVWFYLILAACALTTVEWFLYQRRLIT